MLTWLLKGGECLNTQCRTSTCSRSADHEHEEHKKQVASNGFLRVSQSRVLLGDKNFLGPIVRPTLPYGVGTCFKESSLKWLKVAKSGLKWLILSPKGPWIMTQQVSTSDFLDVALPNTKADFRLALERTGWKGAPSPTGSQVC